jgi:hypothetical protein
VPVYIFPVFSPFCLAIRGLGSVVVAVARRPAHLGTFEFLDLARWSGASVNCACAADPGLVYESAELRICTAKTHCSTRDRNTHIHVYDDCTRESPKKLQTYRLTLQPKVFTIM